MIAIISSAASERSALGALCESRGWVCLECDSLRAFSRALHRHAPHVLVASHRLADGYTDDIFRHLTQLQLLASTKVVVLLDAGTKASIEVRQIALGADCVLRRPVRSDVLSAYIAKYIDCRTPSSPPPGASLSPISFCGANLFATERTLYHRDRSVSLTAREVALVELLAQSAGAVVTYDFLYSEILGRKFRGDTSNMRVLLAKLSTSCLPIGIAIRDHVVVIPKSGYRYHADAREPQP